MSTISREGQSQKAMHERKEGTLKSWPKRQNGEEPKAGNRHRAFRSPEGGQESPKKKSSK